MKTYSHDYTIPTQVNHNIHLALSELRSDNFSMAEVLLMQSRNQLDQYLSQDNMVEDDDVADGWVKMSDIDNLGLIK